MEKKSLHGLAKGTSLEKITEMMALGEAKGTMMYYALARLAREQGMEDVAEKFIEAANQEANHAGFYAVLNGMYPKDFWGLVNGLQKAEAAGEASLMKQAARLREEGFDDAAAEVEVFAKQEGHHGEMLEGLLKKYKPEAVDVAGKKVYVCAVCGFEYIGDLDAEPEDFVCPICGMQKKVFKLKA